MFNVQSDYFVKGAYNRNTFRCVDFPFVLHTVEACRALLQQSQLHVLHEVAADGFSELLQEKINAMDDENFARYLAFHYYICEKPEHLGASSHLLFVAEKPRV